MVATGFETPSGKGARDENFPVGSGLLAARLRPHIADFYAFARAADDIADNPALVPGDKIARLDRFEAALTGRDTDDPALAKAHRLRRSLAETGVTAQHGVDLLAAFKQDATKRRYEDWADLMGYCALSAMPVGRYLLDLHGEARDTWPAADALCSALQILNHLQDVQADYRTLDRVYVPLDWLRAEGLDVTALDQPRTGAALRRVLDRCLDGIAALIAEAHALPYLAASPRMAMESAAIVRLAERLEARLRRGDPLAERVALSRPALVCHAALGAAIALVRRAFGARPARDGNARTHVERIVARSGSSFLSGIRALPAARKRAMYAIYAFCREVDDIADDPGDRSVRLGQLADWRAEIDRLYAGRPTRPTTRALLGPVADYDLPRAEFLAIVDGMESDLLNTLRGPDAATLERYCRQVAGAVGMLSIRVFGAREPEAETIAIALGEALQLTNILRDLAEDASRGRLYLPREALAAHGIATDEPAAVLAHPALPEVCAVVAAQARARFRETRALLARCDRRRLKPCVLMMEVYERVLAKLERQGWRDLERPVRLSPAGRLWIAVRYGLIG